MNYALVMVAYMVAVTLKAYQQRLVGAAEYRKMPFISYGMAACEIFMIAAVIKNADSIAGLIMLWLAMGTGSSLGGMLGTWLHARVSSDPAK